MSRMPISRQIETMVLSRIFIRTMSGGALRGGNLGCAASTGSFGWTIGSRNQPSSRSWSAAHSTHQGEQ